MKNDNALNKTWRRRALNGTLNRLVKVKNPQLNLSLELIDCPQLNSKGQIKVQSN